MNKEPVQQQAVAAIRISSLKQGLQGDSPEAQKEQIERFALNRGIKVKKFFIFMESASKEEQPVQEAIDYCKNPKNGIQLFIIKSIDRFTRGGSYLYDHLKMQLEKHDVRLIDIYGIIGNQDVNTLEHLGISYNWSVYSPTKKSEILEAERAKDEMRDIMTRMIGAEIRYVRMGYRVRQAPFGYVNEKVETPHGKRVILKPHPEESLWIKKMFELRSRGTLSDQEIVDQINEMGYRTRKRYVRNPNDRTKVVGERGGKPLQIKQYWRFIQNPIYAGANIEKWTQGEVVKSKFDGLISIEMYNLANRGKLTLVKNGEEIKLWKKQLPEWQTKKLINNPKFPYKRVIMCPHCNKPLFGSASRGHLGKYYPAYHCNKRGHYFRVTSKELEDTVESFVKNLDFTQEYIDSLKEYVVTQWKERVESKQEDESIIDTKIKALKASAQAAADKIKYLSSEVAIKYLEADLVKAECEVQELEEEKIRRKKTQNTINMEAVMKRIGYFLEHLEELLIDTANPLKRAAFFGLIFDEMPTYADLTSGTPKLAPYLALKRDLGGNLVPFGESYAYLFVPFILYGLVSRHRILTVVAFAALFLSHPVASALFSAVVLGIVVLQALGRSRPGIALREILGFFFSSYLWAFALASYNLVPTLLMTRYTYYAPGNTIPFEHFPTLQQLLVDAWGYGYSVPGAQDNMSFAVGYAQLVVIVLALGALFLRRKRSSGQQPFPAFTIAGILLMFFLACGSMLAASMPLWAVLHFTAILDFPWRLLLVVPFLAALVGFWLTNQIKSTYVQIAVVLGVLVVAVVSQYRHARVGEHWSWGMEHFAQEMDTGDAYGEYAARWRQTRSKPTVGGRFEVLSGEAASTVIVSTSHELSLAVSASTDVTIRLNIMYFPGWRVWLNNEEQTVESGSGRCSISTDDADDGNDLSGLIVCRVSPGHNTLRALYTHTWEQLLGLALTIAALILLIWKPLRSFFPLITKR